MSNAALNWVASLTIGDPTQKNILRIVADYADEKGSCFPSQELIAQHAEMSVRTVARAILGLRDGGYLAIIRERHPTGRYRRNRYVLAMGRPLDNLSDGPSDIDDAAIGQSCLVHNNPHKNHIRESARAPDMSDGGEIGSGDEDFVAFLTGYPNTAIESRSKLWEAWRRLSPNDRAAAVAGVVPFLAETKRAGRTLPVAGFTYLSERKWLSMPAGAAAAAPSTMVFVRHGSQQWLAWQAYRQSQGKRMVPAQHSTEHRDLGWHFPAEWPPKA